VREVVYTKIVLATMLLASLYVLTKYLELKIMNYLFDDPVPKNLKALIRQILYGRAGDRAETKS